MHMGGTFSSFLLFGLALHCCLFVCFFFQRFSKIFLLLICHNSTSGSQGVTVDIVQWLNLKKTYLRPFLKYVSLVW